MFILIMNEICEDNENLVFTEISMSAQLNSST